MPSLLFVLQVHVGRLLFVVAASILFWRKASLLLDQGVLGPSCYPLRLGSRLILFVSEEGLFALVFSMWLTGESRIAVFAFAVLGLIVGL